MNNKLGHLENANAFIIDSNVDIKCTLNLVKAMTFYGRPRLLKVESTNKPINLLNNIQYLKNKVPYDLFHTATFTMDTALYLLNRKSFPSSWPHIAKTLTWKLSSKKIALIDSQNHRWYMLTSNGKTRILNIKKGLYVQSHLDWIITALSIQIVSSGTWKGLKTNNIINSLATIENNY